MKKLTDQELDSVFKNAAEGYKPAFDSAAWDAMNAKLDQPRPTFWKRWMSFALLGMMIFSTGVWVGTRLNKETSLNEAQSNPKDELIQQKKNVEQTNPDQTRFQNQINSQQAQVVDENRVMRYHKKEVDMNSGGLNPKLNSEDHFESERVVQKDEDSDPVVEAAFLLQDEKSAILQDHLSKDSVTDLIENDIQKVKKDSAQADVTEESKKELTNSRSFYLRLLASPDFSSIDYASSTTAGSNYALLADYQLTNRWSISTGGIWSMKKYSSDKETTYGKYTADRMVGDCRVLDIPLNIYYRFLPHSKVSFYAGAGLSSYIMLEEDYTYTFDFPSGSRDFSFYIEKKNNEWFKVLNVSLGVQYQIAQRFHVQVEPFVKAPLSGVGEWDVKLSSMGIFMGLKYKIN